MKNKTNRQALRKLANEADDRALVVIRAVLLDLAAEYQTEEFSKSFPPNSLIHPSLYRFAGREIDKYLEID